VKLCLATNSGAFIHVSSFFDFSGMKDFKAVIFDMDGLLINSEPFWQQAEKEIFKTVGIELSTAMCESMMGLRIDEVVDHWFNYQPWKDVSKDQIREQIVKRVIELIHTNGKLMDGVKEVLEMIKAKGLPMAIASSSNMEIINAVVEKFELGAYFQLLHSAEYEKYGKPHPDIFIHTAEQLGVSPMDCLVFEDSFNGLLAAKAARMTCALVPEPSSFDQARFVIADLKLRSLADFKLT
jgi:sugar-phosphatase